MDCIVHETWNTVEKAVQTHRKVEIKDNENDTFAIVWVK